MSKLLRAGELNYGAYQHCATLEMLCQPAIMNLMRIVTKPMSIPDLQKIANQTFGNLVSVDDPKIRELIQQIIKPLFHD